MLSASSGAGVLSPHANSPPVTETPVRPDFLEPLHIITELGIKRLGKDLRVFAGLEILLPVQEPKRDLELARVLDDSNKLLNLVSGELTSALVHVNLGLLADEIGKPSAKTLDLRQAKDNITLSLNIRIQNTENVLELRSLHQRPESLRGVHRISVKVQFSTGIREIHHCIDRGVKFLSGLYERAMSRHQEPTRADDGKQSHALTAPLQLAFRILCVHS